MWCQKIMKINKNGLDENMFRTKIPSCCNEFIFRWYKKIYNKKLCEDSTNLYQKIFNFQKTPIPTYLNVVHTYTMYVPKG